MLSLYPQLAKKAHLEIDTVTVQDRLPNLEDVDHTAYLNALLLEVMRTFPSTPRWPSAPYMRLR
jgi:hypothetical protein